MKKSDQTKGLFLEQLKKTPIIQIACEKLGISRASFYRWKAEDPEFAKGTDEATLEGYLLVNDLAESQLITAVKDRNLSAVTYWLRHHHPVYANRLELNAKIKRDEGLSPEDEAQLLASIKHMTSIIQSNPLTKEPYERLQEHESDADHTGSPATDCEGSESTSSDHA